MRIQATPARQIQAALRSGTIPRDLKSQDLPLHPDQVESASTRQYWGRVVPMAGVTAVGGAALGMLAGSALTTALHPVNLFLPTLVGAGLGAASGVVLGWSASKDLRGPVTVEQDGNVRQTTWRGTPELHQRNPQEVEAMLLARGELGDEITPRNPQWQGPATQTVAHSAQTLVDLAGQRRLVADLGGQSRYGEPALHLVDANAAHQLAARGGSVFVVDGQKVQDHPHHLRTTAFSATRNQVTVNDYQYTERNFDYQLKPLQEFTAGSAPALGVPEGMLGVYAQHHQFTQTVERRCEEAERKLPTPEIDQSHHHSQASSKIGATHTVPSGIPGILGGLRHGSTKASTISGALFGACGAGVMGLDPTAGLVVGSLTGHLLGRLGLGAPTDSLAARVSRGGMALAGAAAGVGLALQGGLHASLAAGFVGGTFGTAWAVYRYAPQHAAIAVEAGMAVGSALGLAAGLTGSAWAAIPLVAVGAVGGAALGWGSAPKN